MIDVLQKISLLSNALQARNLTLTKAERLIKRPLRYLKCIKKATEPMKEKSMLWLLQILLRKPILLKITKSLALKHLAFCRLPTAPKRPDRSKQCHCLQFAKCIVSLPRQKLLETVTENMKKRLMYCDSLISKNDEQDDKFHDLINFLGPNSWNIE